MEYLQCVAALTGGGIGRVAPGVPGADPSDARVLDSFNQQVCDVRLQ